MKDVTSTSFGLLIAFLLPGIAALYGASFWFDPLKTLCRDFLTAQSNVGLFLLLALLALTAGLLITPIRWLIFECWRSAHDRLTDKNFARLGTDECKLAAFRAAVDEHYRYHQFWGNMTVAMPVVYAGLLRDAFASQGFWDAGAGSLLFVGFEALTAVAASRAYTSYVRRGKRILSGPAKSDRPSDAKQEDSHAERMERRKDRQDATETVTVKTAATTATVSTATTAAPAHEEEEVSKS